MPGLITAASVMVTGATMVALDAAEFVAFSVIGKKLKLNKRGANQTMMTATDFIKAAKAKKAAGLTATVNIVEKAKEVAATAKDAVVSVMPATNKSVDRLAEVSAVLVASLEQRVSFIEEELGKGVEVDAELLTERVQQILGSLSNAKPKKEAAKPAEVVEVAASPAVQGTRPVSVKQKLGGRYEEPKDWSNVPDHN